MEKTKYIKVSEDYSPTVKGRYHPEDGKFTGQRFREEYLQPIFFEYDKIIIDLDDSYGYPSSFREEAFGGLARYLKLSAKKILEKLEFISKDEPPLIDVIIKDIEDAAK